MLYSVNQAETTGRFILRGTQAGGIAGIDGTNWGIEIAFNAGSVKLRAVKSGGVVQESAGFTHSLANHGTMELIHNPASGLSLYAGSHVSNLALVDSIIYDANAPVSLSGAGRIVFGIIRTGGSDTASHYAYISSPLYVKIG